MAFLYDDGKLTLLEEVGEIAIPASQNRFIKLNGVTDSFEGFDRNPYLVAFRASADNSFTFVNVHLYYGSDKPAEMGRRALETFAVARWAARAGSHSG